MSDDLVRQSALKRVMVWFLAFVLAVGLVPAPAFGAQALQAGDVAFSQMDEGEDFIDDDDGMEQLIDIGRATVKLSKTSYTYNGEEKCPNVKVRLGGVTLEDGVDYYVEYFKNKKVGKARVVISGLGNYTGEKSTTFTINKLVLSKAKVRLSSTSLTYNGKARKPSVSISYAGETLRKNVDYKAVYAKNTKAGRAKVVVTGVGSCKGKVTKYFNIKCASLSRASVKLSQKSFTANGKAKKPGVIVRANGKRLKEDVDYSLRYSSNVKAGTAWVHLVGKGNYQGKRAVRFAIKAAPKPRPAAPVASSYILNTNTGKFHYPWCSAVKRMSDRNKAYSSQGRGAIVAQGYSSCGLCHP